MKFKTWIQKFINEDSPIGDLARDNELDPAFPDSNSYNELYDYLYSQNASELCLLSFDKAWQLYKARQKQGVCL
ncbi:sterile alpha motif-like domain-containing protein [Lysinibacillus fusiformis]|uniref:sterile alpha motif-like domain-containing protein n=1 Tax=Lysinibacillus fusiformis TaxID=28031 RepID=UPI00215B5E94|nr:sterile alpha motif-like domain-containing protein [Lysinibacillus fusiformis]MCR8853497.1 sterile alpha motif-like domain-containing protein [Lysinibacillus fusiformis]